MAAWAAKRDGDWSVTSNNEASPWHDGGAQTALASTPGYATDDTCDLMSFAVAWDVANTLVIPVAGGGGSLALLKATTTGRLTLTAANAIDYFLAADNITAGTFVGGLIAITGGAATGTVTITANGATGVTGGSAADARGVLVISGSVKLAIIGVVNGGAGSNSHGVQTAGTGIVTITGDVTGVSGRGLDITSSAVATIYGHIQGGTIYGAAIASTGRIIVASGFNVTGGTGTNAFGLYSTSTNANAVTITDSTITGGSGRSAAGIANGSTGGVTLNNCNLINGAGGMAYQGKPPVWNIAAKANYLQWAVKHDGAEAVDTIFRAGRAVNLLRGLVS